MNIKLIRTVLDITQKDLASQLGVTQQSIAKWEKGATISNPSKILLQQYLTQQNYEEKLKDFLEKETK